MTGVICTPKQLLRVGCSVFLPSYILLVQGEMDKWAKRAIEARFAGKFPWYRMEDFVIEESARIVGGKPIEVTIMNTLTVNVHLSMVSRLS